LFSKSFPRLTLAVPGLLAALLLSACGGGGDARGCLSGCDASTGEAFPIANPDLKTLPPSSTYANVCTAGYQKAFILSYMNENYFLYSKLVPPNTALTNALSVDDYYYALLTEFPTPGDRPATHPSDNYSYVTSTYLANIIDSGYTPGSYGFSWVTDRNGMQRVTYVAPGTPAAAANMKRGGVLTGFSSADSNLYPYGAASTVITYQDPGSPARSISLTTVPFQQDPAPLVTIVSPNPFAVPNHKIGYLLFLNHSTIAQDKLIDSIAYLKGQGITDLVLDLRYNQGGTVHAAQSLASMIAGPALAGQTFEQQIYNGKVPNITLPFTTTVTWEPGITALPPGYNSGSNRVKYSIGYPLPALNLSTVYILTTDLTGSASESLINALQGVDVKVVQIGTLTAGEPYGSNRRDNCNEAYYPIEYQGLNAKGFGDYTGGFTPNCLVHDDFNYPLGDGREALLNAATEYIRTGQCPATATQN